MWVAVRWLFTAISIQLGCKSQGNSLYYFEISTCFSSRRDWLYYKLHCSRRHKILQKNGVLTTCVGIISFFFLSIQILMQDSIWVHQIAPIYAACGPDKTLAQLMLKLLALFHLSPNCSIHLGRSTVTALLSVTEEWFSAHDHGQELCAVFLDYQPLTVSFISH